MAHYLSFLLFAAVVALAPGPDTFLTLRTTVAGGRRRGLWTLAGISTACVLQGVVAATGLGAVIAAAEPVFQAIRWAGVAYLLYLGISALRAALRSGGEAWAPGSTPPVRPWASFRTGFLCNITNPKVLAFNLAVLPQFAGSHARLPELMAYAVTLAAVGTVVLLLVVTGAAAAQRAIRRAAVRRGIEGATGVVMLGFAGALAAEG